MSNVQRWSALRERPGLDPWPAMLWLVAVVVYSVQGLDATLNRDLGLYSYAGQRVVAGEPPYVGVMNRAGPLAHLLPGVGVAVARVGGLDDVTGIRVLFLLLAAACVPAAYLLGRDLFGSRGSGVVTAAAMLSWQGFARTAAAGPDEKAVMTLFILLALWATVRRRWATAGVFVSLATLTLQTAFFVVAVAVAVAVLAEPRTRRLRALVRFGLGGLGSLAVLVAGFTAAGALREFVEGFVLVNSRYTTSSPLVAKAGKGVDQMVDGFGVSVVWLVAGLVALPVLTLLAARRGGRARAPAMLLAAFTAAMLAGVWWVVLYDFDAWPDAFPLLPLAAVGLAGTVDVLVRSLPARVGRGVVAVVAVVGVASALPAALDQRGGRLDEQRRLAAAVVDRLPEATVLSIEAPQALVLARKKNPTRHQMLGDGLRSYLDDTWPGGLRGFREWIVDEERPELVAVGRLKEGWVRRLEPEYQVVGRAPTWVWMARTSLGPDVLGELRAALEAAG